VPLATAGSGPEADVASIVTLVDDHLRRSHVPAVAVAAEDGSIRLDPAFADPPSVSVVIPTAGTWVDPTDQINARAGPGRDTGADTGRGERMVERCLRSLDLVEGQELEIVVVVGEEYDGDPTGLASLGRHRVRVVDRGPGDFNFAVAANVGVLAATGELAVLLNDDTVAHDGLWVERMAMHAVEPSVGAVGATLLFPDGTIQHIGLIIDDARPLHPFVGRRLDDQAPRLLASHPRTVAAVTGACLMVTRAKYLEVGGMSELYPLSFNDVDLCFKLARRGYRTVHEPGARFTHFEGSTRETAIAKWEWDRFVNRWGSVVDPWYHPGYERPDDPGDLRRNADHILPSALPLISPAQPAPRDDRIRSVVHRRRERTAIEPAPTNR
jgi:GT2 family glycosyltransferase